MNIILFGPPGAGKGTQSGFITKKFKLYQLSTGDLLRSEIKNETEIGKKISHIMNKGDLVSDDIVTNLIEKFIVNKETLYFKEDLDNHYTLVVIKILYNRM